MLYAFATICGVFALAVRWLETQLFWYWSVVCIAGLFLGLYLGKCECTAKASTRRHSDHQRSGGFSYKRRVFEVLLDVALIALAYYGAFVLRWDGKLPDEQLQIFLKTLRWYHRADGFFLVGGVYKGLWRYVGITDLLTIARAVIAGAVMSSVVIFVMYWFRGPSRAVALLDLLLLLVFRERESPLLPLARGFDYRRCQERSEATPV
jgi:hypothetical protein